MYKHCYRTKKIEIYGMIASVDCTYHGGVCVESEQYGIIFILLGYVKQAYQAISRTRHQFVRVRWVETYLKKDRRVCIPTIY